jgi:hypothetical protein
LLQRHLICGQRLYARFLSWDLPGDPAEAAGAILHIAGLQDPLLRLLLSSDAVRFVEQNDLAKMEAGSEMARAEHLDRFRGRSVAVYMIVDIHNLSAIRTSSAKDRAAISRITCSL